LEVHGLYKNQDSIKQALTPSKLDGIIGMLQNSEIIKCNWNGKNVGSYEVINAEFGSQLNLRKPK
jgi:hypothetical protein